MACRRQVIKGFQIPATGRKHPVMAGDGQRRAEGLLAMNLAWPFKNTAGPLFISTFVAKSGM